MKRRKKNSDAHLAEVTFNKCLRDSGAIAPAQPTPSAVSSSHFTSNAYVCTCVCSWIETLSIPCISYVLVHFKLPMFTQTYGWLAFISIESAAKATIRIYVCIQWTASRLQQLFLNWSKKQNIYLTYKYTFFSLSKWNAQCTHTHLLMFNFF